MVGTSGWFYCCWSTQSTMIATASATLLQENINNKQQNAVTYGRWNGFGIMSLVSAPMRIDSHTILNWHFCRLTQAQISLFHMHTVWQSKDAFQYTHKNSTMLLLIEYRLLRIVDGHGSPVYFHHRCPQIPPPYLVSLHHILSQLRRHRVYKQWSWTVLWFQRKHKRSESLNTASQLARCSMIPSDVVCCWKQFVGQFVAWKNNKPQED